MIRLSVIVLCYHGDSWIDSCLRSLEDQSLHRQLYEIVLVDNGGSTPAINKYIDRDNIKIIRLSQNCGFTEGNNRALSHTRGEIVVLMNQDIEVHFNCLHELLNSFEKIPAAGVISTNMQMVYADSKFDRRAPAPETSGFFRVTGMGYAQYELIVPDANMVPVDFASGNGLAFRKSVLKDVGNYLFDVRLGSYAEDLDFSIRLQRTTWKMYMNPRAVIFHYRSDGFSGPPWGAFKKFNHISSNRLLVYYKHLKPCCFIRKLPLLLAGVPCKVGRLDGKPGFSWHRFSAGLLATPFVLALFLKKVMTINRNTKASG